MLCINYVQVEIAVVEGKGKEKGPRIAKEAKQHRVSLLVLGQKKQSMVQRLWTVCRGRRTRSRVVEHCIQNTNCITIAVRRKSRKYGGYLITTKWHGTRTFGFRLSRNATNFSSLRWIYHI